MIYHDIFWSPSATHIPRYLICPSNVWKKTLKKLHLSLQSLDPVLAFRSSRHTSCRSSGRHAACLVWNWMAWGGHQLWVPSASSISFRFANQDMFVSFPILGNARGNVDFQAPSNACSPICGSDPYAYNISLVTCIDIQLWMKVYVSSRLAKETSELLSELSSFGYGRTFYFLQNVFTPCTSSFSGPSKPQSQC